MIAARISKSRRINRYILKKISLIFEGNRPTYVGNPSLKIPTAQ